MNNTNKYGDLLDKYMDNAHGDYRTKQEREEEARGRYGNLLDHAKPDNKIYEDMIAVDNVCGNIRRQREDEYERVNLYRQERIEREKKEYEERVVRNDAFVNDFLQKKEAERKAEDEKRKAAERGQNMYTSLQRAIDSREEASAMVARTNAMLAKDKERRKAHEDKMEWYRKQENIRK